MTTPLEELNHDAGYQSDTSHKDPMDMVDSDDHNREGNQPEELQEEVLETHENQPKQKRQKLHIPVLEA